MTHTIKKFKAHQGECRISADLQSWDCFGRQITALQNTEAQDSLRPGSSENYTPPVIAGILAALGCEIGDAWSFPMDPIQIRAQWTLDE